MGKKTDLDVDDAHKVPQVLRAAVKEYYKSMSESSAAWQNSFAGKVWSKVAKELEHTADKLEKIVESIG